MYQSIASSASWNANLHGKVSTMRLTGIRSLSVFGVGAISSLCAAVGCGAVTAIRPQIAATAESTDALPAFSLPSTLGGELKSADVTQSSAVALVFYRGFW